MRILIFAYDFPHWKSSELIKDTVAKGYDVACVVGASFLPMDGVLSPPLPTAELEDTKVVCERLGLKYLAAGHDNKALISAVMAETGASLGLITGARIIKKEIIPLFADGVVNYHPGRIPETSGLDSLHYSILKGIPPCVTAHLIDERVDAGRFIGEWVVAVTGNDTMSSIKRKILEKQVEINVQVLHGLRDRRFALAKIDRPRKNSRLTDAQKLDVARLFPAWRDSMISRSKA